MKSAAFSLFAFLFLLTGQAVAQEKKPYTLLAGDEVHISVWGDAGLDRNMTVLPDGSISFPLAGFIVVEGMTTVEVANIIKSRLVEKAFHNDPEVSVSVTAVSGNQVFVIGKVANPGVYVLNRVTTLPQLLSMAGGLDRFADEDNIRILKSGSKTDFIKFDYNDLLNGDDGQGVNLVMQAGDVVIVP